VRAELVVRCNTPCFVLVTGLCLSSREFNKSNLSCMFFYMEFGASPCSPANFALSAGNHCGGRHMYIGQVIRLLLLQDDAEAQRLGMRVPHQVVLGMCCLLELIRCD
jgi:hypothetical protein